MFCWLRARKILAPCCVSHAFPACLLLGFCAIKAPEVELERLDEWPAEDLNNILHAHDQLQPLFPDVLPCGWKQALERTLAKPFQLSETVWRAKTKMVSFESLPRVVCANYDIRFAESNRAHQDVLLFLHG